MRIGDQAMSLMLWEDKPKKRRKSTPRKLIRQEVWRRDKGICQVCGRRVNRNDWALGHNRPRSRGGKMTMKNTYVVCPPCNRSQHTQTLKEVRRSIHAPETKGEKARRLLNGMTTDQLKKLAERRGIKPRGKVVDSFLWKETLPPTRRQYVNALTKVVSVRQVQLAMRKSN